MMEDGKTFRTVDYEERKIVALLSTGRGTEYRQWLLYSWSCIDRDGDLPHPDTENKPVLLFLVAYDMFRFAVRTIVERAKVRFYRRWFPHKEWFSPFLGYHRSKNLDK